MLSFNKANTNDPSLKVVLHLKKSMKTEDVSEEGRTLPTIDQFKKEVRQEQNRIMLNIDKYKKD